jgi:putative FmdB family regulatory protein
MPTYDYKCSACGHTFDEMQKFSDPPLTKCPECKKNKLERLFGGGGAIIFKGGGFYETDYRRAGEKGDATEKAAEAPKSEAKEAKSETPGPAAESAPKPAAESKGAKKKDK